MRTYVKTLFNPFSDSVKEFCQLKSLITAALLIAIHTVMSLFLSITVTQSLRISISFVANVIIGCLYGPVMGMVCGGLGDIIQYVIKPSGPYFIGWTINAALAGLMYGSFFYNRLPKQVMHYKEEDNNKTTQASILNTFLYIIPVVTIIICLVVPFTEITDKSTNAIIAGKTALSVIIKSFSNSAAQNAAIICAIIIMMAAALIIMNYLKYHVVSLMLNVFITFAAVLSMYTDKKTTTTLWGFWLFFALQIGYMLLQIVYLCRKHSLDIRFMLRCILVLSIETVIVNIILGTYWVNVMYGKGFLFYLTSRVIKNLIQLPINIIITYYALVWLGKIKKHISI